MDAHACGISESTADAAKAASAVTRHVYVTGTVAFYLGSEKSEAVP